MIVMPRNNGATNRQRKGRRPQAPKWLREKEQIAFRAVIDARPEATR